MKTALRLTIQFAWAYVGLFGCYVAEGLLWGSHFSHVPPSSTHGDWIERISDTSGLLLVIFFLAIVIRAAYNAIFRFSENTVNVTVSFALVVMVCFYIYGNHYYLQPLVTTWIRSGRNPILPLLGSAITLASLAGIWKFGAVMPGVLRKVLFQR